MRDGVDPSPVRVDIRGGIPPRSLLQKIPKTHEAVTVANRAARDTLNDFKGGQNVPYRDVLETQILAAQAGVQYNEARYQYLLALAALEPGKIDAATPEQLDSRLGKIIADHPYELDRSEQAGRQGKINGRAT